MLVILNVVLNYAAWFGVAMLAARGQFAWAVLPSMIAIAIHLAVTERGRRQPEVVLCLAALPIGIVVESLNVACGATRFAEGASAGGMPPAFMLGLWMAFATLVNVSLAWLKDRLALAVLFGAVAAPLSYYAGAKIGALTIGEPTWQSLAIIGAAWTLALPVLFLVARRIG